MQVCNWVKEEMERLKTGDKRLDNRTKLVLQAIMEKPNLSFTQIFQSSGELKACYRLFDSDQLHSETILEPHLAKTTERIQAYTTVVIASDTTSLNYTTRISNPDSGYISSNHAQGFLMHTALATTLDRQPLGVVSAKFWARNKIKPEKKVHRDYLPIEEKESYRWIESYSVANKIARQCPNTQIIHVADREADLIELWETAVRALQTGNAAHLIVRCNHNRTVIPTQENANSKLFEFGKHAPVIGHCEFELKDRATHSVIRNVKQCIRASSVYICPAYRSGVEERQVFLNLVFMEELDPPTGDEPIQWYLLTTLPIQNNEDVQNIIRAYLSRWDIEILFRTFKTGCRAENRSLRTADRLYPMFALFLIVAWRINSLSRISRIHPELPCTVIFSEKEWQAAYVAINKSCQAHTTVPTLREMLIMVARLGGYLNRKNDPEPGAKVIWRGLEYLRIFMEALEIAQSLNNAQNQIFVKKRCG
jgi:hypothetical protein